MENNFELYSEGDSTVTYSAIEKMRSQLFSQQNGARSADDVMKVGVVLTDGVTNPAKADKMGQTEAKAWTQYQASEARKRDIFMFAVGVGRKTDQDELKGIASDPDSKFVIQVDSYQILNTAQLINLLSYQACRGMS